MLSQKELSAFIILLSKPIIASPHVLVLITMQQSSLKLSCWEQHTLVISDVLWARNLGVAKPGLSQGCGQSLG